MDDLSGLDWSASSNKSAPKAAPSFSSGANYYGSMQPTPSPFASGRNTPLSAQGTQQKPPAQPTNSAASKAPAPATDSFSNLVNFGPTKSNANLSLREQQERLETDKRRKADEQRKQTEAQFGNGQFWDSLGSNSASRTASPAIPLLTKQTTVLNGSKSNDDDDLFAAFHAETKVDNASHYPPPPEKKPSPALDLSDPSAWGKPSASSGSGRASGHDDDDDPFNLNMSRSKAPAPTAAFQSSNADDDFLGDLGRPVEEVRRKQPMPQPKAPEPGKPIEESDSSSEEEAAPPRPPRGGQSETDEFDRAVAQLTDYGFSLEDARRALTESGAGLNVQAAANWLLDDAHRRAKAKAEGREPSPSRPIRGSNGGRDGSARRANNQSPAGGEDLAKTAQAMGNSFFKTANSLWKSGKKQVAQAYADFNQEGDPSQPKWMRSAQQEQTQGPRPSRQPRQETGVTDEAMMLDAGARPERKASPQAQATGRPEPPRHSSRGPSPGIAAPSSARQSPAPRWQQPAPMIPDSKSRANKLAMDDDSLSSYSSPNRRRRNGAQPQSQPPSQPEPRPEQKQQPQDEEMDLLFNSQAPKPQASLPQRPTASSQTTQPAKRPTPSAAPKPVPRSVRQVPAISPAAIQQSTQQRLDGTQKFKRGDYASAHASYSSALAAVPPDHPLAIVILTNRALTSLKTGEPKKAVEDADAALKIIGPSGGSGEHVAVTSETGGEERRDMRDLYGKALSRKAEALEQMERWADAGSVWQLCVEGGVGGASAIAGRQRCQKALAPPRPQQPPKPKASTAPPTRPAVRPRPPVPSSPQKSSEAVDRLRKQNQAAAAEDDEKFALSEKVDARIAAWRDGKRDNLRALLGSLDTVLWEDSGWKKVGLHELVMANKVKVVYMKAIAKTHPDKLPQDAGTEQRLIAATVFATLNESWDKFKAENGL